MVLPNKYLDPKEPTVIGTCEGCGEEVLDFEEAIEFDGDVLLHDEFDCITEYVRLNSTEVIYVYLLSKKEFCI